MLYGASKSCAAQIGSGNIKELIWEIELAIIRYAGEEKMRN